MDAVPPAAIFDVDGTLADVSSIRHYVLGPKGRNFGAFHAASALVPPNHDVVERAHQAKRDGLEIIVVTARREQWRYVTATWLQKWGVPVEHLLMRGDHDDRPDVEVKRSLLRKIRKQFEVVLAVDDNPSVIALWRSEGIPVEVVPGWVEPT